MKKIGEYTCRGQTNETESTSDDPKRIMLFDGRFDTGYKITAFYAWSGDWSGGTAPDTIAKLTTSTGTSTAATVFMDASDQREIAWAGTSGGLELWGDHNSIIDRDNLVVEDLYVYARAGSADVQINYLIEMDKYDISEWQGALTMAKDAAQS